MNESRSLPAREAFRGEPGTLTPMLRLLARNAAYVLSPAGLVA